MPYDDRVYQPIVGEIELRVKLRRPLGRVTVPVLTTDDGQVIGDSALIARWVDGRGDGPVLFPPEHATAIDRFIALSEIALDAGRALSLRRVLGDEEALAEMVPRRVRSALGGAATRLAAATIRRTIGKYGGDRSDPETQRGVLVGALDTIRGALAKAPPSTPATLLGRFTFADIAASQILVGVEPPATSLKLGPANRRCWGDDDLRARYADLVAWRDALYAAFRPVKVAS